MVAAKRLYSELARFCSSGINAGKPGPCPAGGEGRAHIAAAQAAGATHPQAVRALADKLKTIPKSELKQLATEHGLRHSSHPMQVAMRALASKKAHVVAQYPDLHERSKLTGVDDSANDHLHVVDAVKQHGGKYNRAPMAKVREHLASKGIGDRAAQDIAINRARLKWLVSAAAIEGRHGVTPEERDAAIREDGNLLGSLSLRQHSERFSESNHSLEGVEIFCTGKHKGKIYTRTDLDDMVENFNLFSRGQKPGMRVPFVVGHEEDQKWLERTDLPAAGWLTRIWRDGVTLLADIEDVADEIADLIRTHRFRTVSAEVYDEPPSGLPGEGKMLRRVAMLGATPPEVKDLADIPMPKRHSESRRFASWNRVPLNFRTVKPSATPGAFWCFSEVARSFSMPAAGSPQARAMWAKATLADAKNKKTGRYSKSKLKKGTPKGGWGFAEGDDMPAKDDMLDMLGQMGFDTDTLKNLDDAALGEILRVLTDGDDEPIEDDEPVEPDPYSEADDKDGLAAHALDGLPTPKDDAEKKEYAEHARRYAERVRRHADRAKKYMEKYCDMGRHADDDLEDDPRGANPADPRGGAVDKHSEKAIASIIRREIRKAIDGNVSGAIRQLEGFRDQQIANQKQMTVETFCEAQLKAGKLTPGEYQSKASGGPGGSVYRRLLRANANRAVEKFSENGKTVELTDLQAQMREIEERPSLFSERFSDPVQRTGSKDEEDGVLRTHYHKFSEDYRKGGYSSFDDFHKSYLELNESNRQLMLQQYRASLQA